MILSIIVAMDEQRGIGLENRIPWRLRDDMKNFKRLTMGHPLIVGRKTWESIGRPLPGRTMIVMTRNPDYRVPAGVAVAPSLDAALGVARANGAGEVFIGGGAGIYAATLPLASRIYLTRVHATVQADTRFPKFDRTQWVTREQATYAADGQNEFSFAIEWLERET